MVYVGDCVVWISVWVVWISVCVVWISVCVCVGGVSSVDKREGGMSEWCG